jgi:hypothetical protein
MFHMYAFAVVDVVFILSFFWGGCFLFLFLFLYIKGPDVANFVCPYVCSISCLYQYMEDMISEISITYFYVIFKESLCFLG